MKTYQQQMHQQPSDLILRAMLQEIGFFSSGQIPVDPATGEVAGPDIAAQAEQSCKNVKAVIEAAGSDISKVFKTTCFLADMADFATFNSVYEKYFTSKPARSCVAVKTLPKNVLCEIEAIAEL